VSVGFGEVDDKGLKGLTEGGEAVSGVNGLNGLTDGGEAVSGVN